jgi:hypothetical protein
MRWEINVLFPWIAGIAILSVSSVVSPFRGRHVPNAADWTSQDIARGSLLALPPSDLFGRDVDSKKSSLLVFAGACSSCSLNSVPLPRLYSARFDQIVVIYFSSKKQLLQTFRKPDPHVLVIPDGDGALVGLLGAQSAPRFYVLKGGRIQSVWKDIYSWPSEWIPERNK